MNPVPYFVIVGWSNWQAASVAITKVIMVLHKQRENYHWIILLPQDDEQQFDPISAQLLNRINNKNNQEQDYKKLWCQLALFLNMLHINYNTQ
jgi:carbon starvation protein CstA